MSILGVWMWPQSVRLYGAALAVQRCASAGITDIFFLTKGLAGTTAHRSSCAPMSCEHDLLRELIDSAHALGIRVHAWLTSASDEHYKRLHPESGRCHYTRGRDKGLISLTDGGYIAYMQDIVRELCAGYDIDGLHLDYIRYNHLLYGWSEADQRRYQAAGADIPHVRQLMDATFLVDHETACIFDACRAGDESVRALAHARRQDVCAFARALSSCARAEKPGLMLSAALMPEGAYEDTTFADLHYGQSYDDAAALYDCILPMAYSKAYARDSAWVRAVAQGALSKGLKTVMGLHAYDGGTGPSLLEDMAALGNTAVSGVCLFREGAFALALADGRRVRLINTLERPITALCAGADEPPAPLGSPLLPGEETSLLLPHAPRALRLFTDEGEVCVFLAAG